MWQHPFGARVAKQKLELLLQTTQDSERNAAEIFREDKDPQCGNELRSFRRNVRDQGDYAHRIVDDDAERVEWKAQSHGEELQSLEQKPVRTHWLLETARGDDLRREVIDEERHDAIRHNEVRKRKRNDLGQKGQEHADLQIDFLRFHQRPR